MGSPLIDNISPLAPLFFSLTIWSVGVATLAWLTLKSDSNTFARLMGALLAVLMASFATHSLIIFYFMFELSLIPIFLLVLGWGYQPERSYAGLSMVFYTLIASLPLLAYSALTTTYTSSSEMIMAAHFMLPSSGNCKFWISLFLSGGFLIKLPIFGGHLWLPRAHVEAPMEGSMLLAAIMLKLGGYGLIFISPIILPSGATNLISAFSLAGGALIALTCLRQTDAKMLIAYSSVAHMSLALASSLSGKILGVWAAVVAYISHGFVSSGLFMGANFLYLRSSSRNIAALTGHLSYLPLFSMSWFILCMGNMGAPPTPNLLAEIFMIASLFLKSTSLLIPSLLMAALATAFTLNLYMATQHSAPPGATKWASPLTAMEIISLISHSLLTIMGASALTALM